MYHMSMWPEVGKSWAAPDYSGVAPPGVEASEAESEEEASSDQTDQQGQENVRDKGLLMSRSFPQAYSHCSALTKTCQAVWCCPRNPCTKSRAESVLIINFSVVDGPGDNAPSHRLEDLSEEDFDDEGAASEDSDVQRMQEKLAEQKRCCARALTPLRLAR